jgi:Domain of unknown function (DUF4410)
VCQAGETIPCVVRARHPAIRAAAAAAALSFGYGACSAGGLRRELVGGATSTDRELPAPTGALPEYVYVANFAVDEGAVKGPSGVIGGLEQAAQERPRLIGGGIIGGILDRRTSADVPSADQVVDTLASSITDALNEQHLGFFAERIPPGAPAPSGGWLVKGRLVSVDPGNRALRAVVGFGAGDATTEVTVEVDNLGSETVVPLLRFGTHAESSKMPGGAVTLNPYVMAAKFVLGRQATTRDVHAMGKEIAKQIADYTRSRGGAGAPTPE